MLFPRNTLFLQSLNLTETKKNNFCFLKNKLGTSIFNHWKHLTRCKKTCCNLWTNDAIFLCSSRFRISKTCPTYRDGKKFQPASNAGVNFFLAPVKCVPKFTLFCCKSELCCDFPLFGVILKGFYSVHFKIMLSKENFLFIIT